MRVILNSDVIYATYMLRDHLPEGLASLCVACSEAGHVIVVPTTTLLEFERGQRKHVLTARQELRQSFATLRKNGVNFEELDPDVVIAEFDLIASMRSTGVTVEVVEPTHAQFLEAHRRACLRETPHTGGDKSDEMRDLIIWSISLELARVDSGAMLISRDKIHTGDAGSVEAAEAGLVRESDLGMALERLHVETPAFRLANEIFASFWSPLRQSGLPVGNSPKLLQASQTSFVRDEIGIVRARFRARIDGDSTSTIEATCAFERVDVRSVVGELRSITISGQPVGDLRVTNTSIAAPFNEQAAGDQSADEQRLRSLRGILEDGK